MWAIDLEYPSVTDRCLTQVWRDTRIIIFVLIVAIHGIWHAARQAGGWDSAAAPQVTTQHACASRQK